MFDLVLKANLWRKHDSSFYHFSSKSYTYFAAKEYCETLGAHLADINSFGENIFLKNYISRFIKKDVWIGARNYFEYLWLWENSGINMSNGFEDWNPGEPSPGSEYCVEMRRYYSYKWNNTPCNDQNGIVCEMHST